LYGQGVRVDVQVEGGAADTLRNQAAAELIARLIARKRS
jgi:hypothetical protein